MRNLSGSINMTTDNTHSGSFLPWLGAKIVGRKATRVEGNHESIRIEHNGKHADIKQSAICRIDVVVNILWATVVIELNNPIENTLWFRGIAKREASRIFQCLYLCRHGRQIQEAISEYDAMLASPGYLNRQLIATWIERYKEPLTSINDFVGLVLEDGSPFAQWRRIADKWESRVNDRNNKYVKLMSMKWRAFFDKLEANPLTDRQVEGVVRDEDHTLVVAGAGTGKTSVVVGKIGFLIESNEVKPSKILALAFGRDAAGEMRNRVAKYTGHDVEIRTFHALGRQIVLNATGEKPVISDVAGDDEAMHALISRLASEMIADETTRDAVVNFAVFHRYPAKYLEDFDNNGNYFTYMRKHEPRTLRGERVKSFEELLIADWLQLNGVPYEYEYEYPYKYKTAKRKRRRYKPDFYLIEAGIYLEHFGIGRRGETAPWIDSRKYAKGIAWKRKIHREHKTKLIETYSWERQEGIILEQLKVKLNKAGIKTKPMAFEQIKELLEQREINNKLVALLRAFLNVYKEGQWNESELLERAGVTTANDRKRVEAFLSLFNPFLKRYETWLSNRGELDYADLITHATNYLESGEVTVPFRRIIVDEYQDISRGRQRLLRALLKQTDDTRIMCVGDDWQSIYGFTGSDLRMTTEFESVFGYTARVDLDQTFRFTQPILDSSSRFIQQNPKQLRKEIKAQNAKIDCSMEIIIPDLLKPVDLDDIFHRTNQERPSNKRWSVLLLGRYNFTNPEGWQAIAEKYKMLDVQFMTIHKSKGIEADIVVILDLASGRYGFPGEVESDPLMSLVLPAEEDYPRAEERRVLYVAMTRARMKVFLVVNPSIPSEFILELKKYSEVHVKGEN